MILKRTTAHRRGAILPFAVVTLVMLIGFVALAVDLGMIAVARTQAQNAADAGAMAGARTLDGNAATANNSVQALINARQAARDNKILGQTIPDANIITELGSYMYDESITPAKFVGRIPAAAGEPYSLMRLRVENMSSSTSFARIFGVNSFNVSAQATAVHRPRDITIILDFSGSMRFASLVGVPYAGNRDSGVGGDASGSNNPETVYPRFGHYSSASAGLQYTADRVINGLYYDQANTTAATAGNDNRTPIVNDFHQSGFGAATKVPAFNNANGSGQQPEIPPDSYETTPGGDNCLTRNNAGGQNYAINLADVLTGNPNVAPPLNVGWETNGYTHFTNLSFNGYTQGPRFWGKTFFIWPPDPRAAHDWRQKFFVGSDGITPITNNTSLWSSSGNWRAPRSGGTIYYNINYSAIINWLKNTGPNPFPSVVRAGNLVYYTALPDHTDGTLNARWWTLTYSNNNERIWKEYIDHVLGLRQYDATTWDSNVRNRSGYGDDFAWGTVRINSKPAGQSMDYQDNPRRPRTRLWFGAMTFVDFLGNYNEGRYWWPGNCHEAPLYGCKIGIQTALDSIRDNHPNDYISLSYFAHPRESATDSGGRFNGSLAPMGKNYLYAKNALFFPLKTLKADGTGNGTEVTPYDADNIEVPRAQGGTCYAMGLMLAYNQLACAPPGDTTLRRWITPTANIPEGMAGGKGRNGAQKIVIFETDGNPTHTATPSPSTPVDTGTFKYYKIRYNPANKAGSEYPVVDSPDIATIETQINAVIDAMVAQYSTIRKPLRLHCIGFGPNISGSSSAQTRLRLMQERGNVVDGFPAYKVVNGTDTQVVDLLNTAFTNIIQGGAQVTLIE